MTKKTILEIEKPHFVVRLSENLLEVDLKEGAKKELEDAIEARPILRESLGILFQTVVPLDVALHEIESTKVDSKGQLRIIIPLRRDITIPLDVGEAKRLSEKLNELIPLAKLKEAERQKALEEVEEAPRNIPRGIPPKEPF